MTINYTNCPVCGTNNLLPLLQVNDFCVSNKQFGIIQCTNCTVAITQDVPNMEAIIPYYHFSNYISHTDTKGSFLYKVYHKVRNITLQQKFIWIKKYTKVTTGNILDIGCGTGAFLKQMQNKKWQITGIEADEKSRLNAKNINNITALPQEAISTLKAGSFDAITMWHVLEHVHQLQEYMQYINMALKPCGAVFIAVPNYQSYDAKVYKNAWAAYDVPRHLYHFSYNAMEALAHKNGFVIKAYKAMWFDSFYVSLLSAGYNKSSKIGALFIALMSNINAIINKKKCSSITYVLTKIG